MNKLTSFTHHNTSEGDRLSLTYSVIEDDGTVTEQNIRKTYVILPDIENNNEVLAAVNTIKDFLQTKIEG